MSNNKETILREKLYREKLYCHLLMHVSLNYGEIG